MNCYPSVRKGNIYQWTIGLLRALSSDRFALLRSCYAATWWTNARTGTADTFPGPLGSWVRLGQRSWGSLSGRRGDDLPDLSGSHIAAGLPERETSWDIRLTRVRNPLCIPTDTPSLAGQGPLGVGCLPRCLSNMGSTYEHG